MAYQEFTDNPELEFEFFLAEMLGMTVSRLRKEMPDNREFIQWRAYMGRKAQRIELARKNGG